MYHNPAKLSRSLIFSAVVLFKPTAVFLDKKYRRCYNENANVSRRFHRCEPFWGSSKVSPLGADAPSAFLLQSVGGNAADMPREICAKGCFYCPTSGNPNVEHLKLINMIADYGIATSLPVIRLCTRCLPCVRGGGKTKFCRRGCHTI